MGTLSFGTGQQSVTALAAIVQRAEPNVSRTLSKLVDAGFVTMHEGKGRARVPEVKMHRVTIGIDALHRTERTFSKASRERP